MSLMGAITDGEAILRRETREISILVAREEVTITHARCSAGERLAGPHVHHEHTDGPARWLTIHARDGGFAAFMRGIRDGVEVEWDISAVPPDGGLPASDAIVRS